ncbi:cation channel family protein (macronuclear) [Tetrahymena thermophila SB210]|uniref:Cation channel family protein n=1 Tax=Tetrahymena thermophila (strain SB210) TaxID=312017 RepID=Q24CD2_TETTS|nr:cation channel family protein [Tetrahymena thermophila SB210]EAS05442.2 cation channel family protein [Tetrahymena thermophila SB210]|eukprot:XP_001025687.2 cation channel family protein [Tetrahymena thermophila SB210]
MTQISKEQQFSVIRLKYQSKQYFYQVKSQKVMNFFTQSEPYIEYSQNNNTIQQENSYQADQSQQILRQNIKTTEYDQEISLEDINYRNQLEMIKNQSTSFHIFKSNIDDFKFKKDCYQVDNSSEIIDSPESSSNTNDKSQQDNSPSFSIQQVEIDKQQKKDNNQPKYENQSKRKHRSGSQTWKNSFNYQQQQQLQNESQYLSPIQNKSNTICKSTQRENSVRSSSICRSLTKKRSTLLAIRNSNLTLNPQTQQINGSGNQNISNQQENQAEETYFYNPIDKTKNHILEVKIFQIFSSIIGGFLNRIKTFSPDNLLIMWMNLFVLLIQFFQLIIYPLKSSFQIQDLENNQIYEDLFRIFPIIIGLLEISFSFNISYYENGIIISDRKEIIKNYFKKKFFFDIVCILIVQLNYNNGMFIVDLLFAIFSIKKIIINIKTINEHFQIEQRFSTSYDLMKLCLLVFYMGHYCACGYYYIGMLYSPNWIIHYGFSNDAWYSNYVNSLYFTFITMITVGFGDIAPINSYEKIYVIFMTIGTCGVFAYSINTIGRIFSEMALSEAKYRNKKFEITKLMQQRNITKKTQRKVIKFLEYEQSQEMDSSQKGEEILLKISKSLRDEVNREYFGKFLNDIKLFRLNFSMEFIMKLTSHVKEKTFGPNEIIFSEGDLDRTFYFICSGQVQLYLNNKISQNRDDFDLISVGKGSLLGINSFLTGNPKDMSAKSLNGSHLIYCSESDFLQTLKLFESDYEKYCMLKDSINLYNDHQGLPCFSCNKFDHQASKCVLYNLKVDKELINFRHIYCPEQKRKQEGRVSVRRKNVIQALSHKQICQISLKRLRLFYISQIYNYSEEDEDEDDNDDENTYKDEIKSDSECQLEESNIKVQKSKLNIDDKINDLKDDKKFFLNVKKIKLKDLQSYLESFNQSQGCNQNLFQQENDSQFYLESESDSENDLQTSSQNSDFNKYSNQSSIKSQQKTQSNIKKEPTLSNIQQAQNSPYTNRLSTKQIDSNIDLRNKSISINSQHDIIQHSSPQLQNQNFDSPSNRHSIIKSLNQVKSRMSIHANLEDNQAQLLKQFQAQCGTQDDFQSEKTIDMTNSRQMKKNSSETKDYQSLESEASSTLNQNTVNTNLTKKVIPESKRRISYQISKKMSIFNKEEHSKLSKIDISDNIQMFGQKLKYSMKQLGQNHILDFPAKYFDIFDQFDKYKDYSYYFPQSNPSIILKEQRRKTYHILLLMRYNKNQLNNKYNSANSVPQTTDQDTKSMNVSPKKLNALHHLIIMKQIQQTQQQQMPSLLNQISQKESNSNSYIKDLSISSQQQVFNLKK